VGDTLRFFAILLAQGQTPDTQTTSLTLLIMNADKKRLIKQFVMDRLWSNTDKLREDLNEYAIVRGIDEFKAMEEYEYQVERIQKMLACY